MGDQDYAADIGTLKVFTVPSSEGVYWVRQQTSIRNTALLNFITYFSPTGLHPLNHHRWFHTPITTHCSLREYFEPFIA